ncbi:MAG: hypothetical protein JSR48_08895 [Verrucomicrobia bacterium]|nr:hypothetical protein [Verrucomicrobiota bacterium]
MKALAWIASFGLLALLAAADWTTTYELNLTALYYVPIVFGGWMLGRWGGAACALCSIVCWSVADYRTAHPYSEPFFRYWNIGMHAFAYALVAYLTARLHSALAVARLHAAEKQEALQRVEAATAEVRAMEGTFQTVCSWTQKIRDGDEWITLEEYLERHLKIRLTHGMSPEGQRIFRAASEVSGPLAAAPSDPKQTP